MNLPGKTTQAAKLVQVGSHQIWTQAIQGIGQKIQFQIRPTGRSQPRTRLRWSPQPPQRPKDAIASAVESSCKFVEAMVEHTTTNACSSSMPVRGTRRSKLSRKAAVVRAQQQQQQQQQLNRRLYNQTRTQPPQRTLSGWSFARGRSSRAA